MHSTWQFCNILLFLCPLAFKNSLALRISCHSLFSVFCAPKKGHYCCPLKMYVSLWCETSKPFATESSTAWSSIEGKPDWLAHADGNGQLYLLSQTLTFKPMHSLTWGGRSMTEGTAIRHHSEQPLNCRLWGQSAATPPHRLPKSYYLPSLSSVKILRLCSMEQPIEFTASPLHLIFPGLLEYCVPVMVVTSLPFYFCHFCLKP